MNQNHLTAIFGGVSFATATAIITSFILLKNPENTLPSAPIIELGTICKANREDKESLRAQLPTAPVMSTEIAELLTTNHKGPGPAPILEQNPEGDGTMILRWLDDQGRPHREGGPATIVFDPIKKTVIMDIWSLNGLMHRENGKPASTEWDRETKRVLAQTWREWGMMHNLNGAALRMFDWDQNILTQRWHHKDDTRRLDNGPTYTKTDLETGIVFLEEWETRLSDLRLTHGPQGIHKIEHDRKTAISVLKFYNFHDMESHSDQITYEIRMSPITGANIYEEWKKNDNVRGYITYTAEGKIDRIYPDQQTINRLKIETNNLHQIGNHHDHNQHENHAKPKIINP